MYLYDLNKLENLIHSCGFYKNKAKNLKAAGQYILDNYNGKVPNTPEELIKIPGVGRKSANVIMLEAFNNPVGIAVDTHVKRFTKQTEPEKIEQDLLKNIPKELWKDVNHTFIYHGRSTCKAPTPKCDICPIKKDCEYNKKKKA